LIDSNEVKKRPEGRLNINVTRMPRQYVICRRKSL